MKKSCLPLKLFVKALSDFSSSSVFGQSWQLWHNCEPGEPAPKQLKIARLELREVVETGTAGGNL
jgi:hypothetical protein